MTRKAKAQQLQDAQKERKVNADLQSGMDALYKGHNKRGANAELSATEILRQRAKETGVSPSGVRDVTDIRVGAFRVTPVGLALDGQEPESNDWDVMGQILLKLEGSIQWLIGDWLVYGMDLKYGDVAQIAEDYGFSYGTLRNYMTVSRAFELSLRGDNLSYGHYKMLTTFDEEWKRYFIQWAEENNASIAQLRDHIQQKKLELEPPSGPLHHIETPFDKSRLPKVSPNSSKLQRWWSQSRLGNEDAKKNLRDAIHQYRKWLDTLEDSGQV